MKTSEFIEEVEKLGYEVKEFTHGIDVCSEYYGTYCYVSKNVMCVIDTEYEKFKELRSEDQEKLFCLVAEYATTPIEEREEINKYRLRLPNTQKTDYESYLNYNLKDKTYFIGDETNIERFKTEFTEEEIDNLPEQSFIKTLIQEEVDED